MFTLPCGHTVRWFGFTVFAVVRGAVFCPDCFREHVLTRERNK
jgi:hypothetical protein